MTVADPTDFLDDENWHGGYYELAIDLGERTAAGADARLVAALRTVWADSALEGCYLDRWRPRSEQTAITPAAASLEEPPPLYGTATLPGGSTVVCVTHVVRGIDGEGRTPHDWLDLCIPTGALGRVDTRVSDYPFGDDGSLAWRAPIDEWMYRVAAAVFRIAPFRVALIGFEVSGDPAADLEGPVPDDRWVGYVLPGEPEPHYFPSTK